ncbi:hypothetical protein FRC07_010268 [Ceratobasidium sp. 392]|nr:hypothetical protein FRC07_010268 [Ceratobasidium sp. 392]
MNPFSDHSNPGSPARHQLPETIGADPGDRYVGYKGTALKADTISRYTRLVKRTRSRAGSQAGILGTGTEHGGRPEEWANEEHRTKDRALRPVDESEPNNQVESTSPDPRSFVDHPLSPSVSSPRVPPPSAQPVYMSALSFDTGSHRPSLVPSDVSEPLPTYTGFNRHRAPATEPIQQRSYFDDPPRSHFTNPFENPTIVHDRDGLLRRRVPAPGPDPSYYSSPPIPSQPFNSIYDAYGHIGRTTAIQPSAHYWSSLDDWDDDDDEKHRLANYHAQADWDPDDEYYDPEPSVASRRPYDETTLPGYYLPHGLQHSERNEATSIMKKSPSGTTIIVGSEKGRKQYITENICPMEQRRSFILVLSKALLQFQAPSHRIENQLSAAARVLDVPAEFLHLPSLVLVSFGSLEGEKGAPTTDKRRPSNDSKGLKSTIAQALLGKETETDQDTKDQNEAEDKEGGNSGVRGATFGIRVHIVKSGGRLELGKLHELHKIYRKVVHDEMSAQDARIKLLKLTKQPPIYGLWERCMHAFFCGLLICVMSFGGSFLDMWVAGAGCATIAFLQLNTASKNPMYSNIFEISAAMLMSFIARGLSSIKNNLFCYSAISSSGVVLILPGSIVLASSLELASRNIISGSVKMVYAIVYSLFLGFSLTIGSDLYYLVDSSARPRMVAAINNLTDTLDMPGVFTDDNGRIIFDGAFSFLKPAASVSNTVKYVSKGCMRNMNGPWYLQQLPIWTLLILVPVYSTISSLWKLQPFRSKQLPVMVIISCASYAANKGGHALPIAAWLPLIPLEAANQFIFNRSDVVSAIGAFVTGILGNAYARIFRGTAFTAMVTAVSFLVPSGIAAAGGLAQTYENSEGDQYSTGLALGFRMVQGMDKLASFIPVGTNNLMW